MASDNLSLSDARLGIMSQPTAQLLALADFNDARLNEDEAAARATTDAEVEEQLSWAEVRVGDAQAHIERHTPTRVLREVAAKRVLVGNWRQLILRIDAESDPDKRERLALTRHGLDQAAYQLASAYADHPDYEDTWRP